MESQNSICKQKIDLKVFILDETLSKILPENLARKFRTILLGEENGRYLLGMVNPLDIFATDELHNILKKPLKSVLVDETDLNNKLDQLYRRTGEITNFADKLASELLAVTAGDFEEKQTQKDDPAVIKLLNSLLEDALQIRASDVHIEPGEEILRIRLRVDGRLQEQTISILGREYIAQALAQRLKLISGLNIAEKRLPQDGRFKITVHGKNLEVRISTLPVQHGESVVLRLLNKSTKILNLEESGMPDTMLRKFRKLIKMPRGIILVTGPTGSGKTTTLYGALTEINDVAKNIVTIEDPVEYTLERINQVQINPIIGLTFAKVLRSVLRQDPNIILIGEIRDQETASIALRAALTGHLVFATLHTNDAPSTAIRLLDMGAESYLIASTIRVIIAQRLLRRVCSSCIDTHIPNEEEKVFFANFFGHEFDRNTFVQGNGCAYCNFTGYRGMIGVFEMLELDPSMRESLRLKDTNKFMLNTDHQLKGSSMFFNAFTMAKHKVTSLEEVMRIAGE